MVEYGGLILPDFNFDGTVADRSGSNLYQGSEVLQLKHQMAFDTLRHHVNRMTSVCGLPTFAQGHCSLNIENK